MRRALLVVCVAAACGSSPQPPPTGPIDATITTYDFTFDLATRHASAILTATVNTGGDCLTLPFRAKNLTNVTIDGVAAGGALAQNLLTICGAGWDAGSELTITADMDVAQATLGASQVGYSVSPTPGGGQFDYLVSWVEGCDQFAPCDNRPNVFAHYHFHVTHPTGVTVLCPGIVTENGGVTDCAFDYDGGPTYSGFGIAAHSAWHLADLGMWGGVHATMYDEPSGATTALVDTTWFDGYLTWLQGEFGPYPYGTDLRVAVAPTYWSGFEHPGNIVLDDGLACSGPKCSSYYLHPVTHVLTHEIAHQWAGDQTTLSGLYDFVWKESMAEYLAFTYESMQDPPAALATARAWKTMAQSARYYPVPTGMPALIDYYGDVYGPGPMILFHQIEGMSSQAAVLAALKSLLGTPHAIGVADVEAALEKSTGLDLTAYFAAWMAGAGAPVWPQVSATWIPAPQPPGGVLQVSVTNAAMTTGKTCVFDVALRDAAGAQEKRVTVDTVHGGASQSFTIADPGFTVSTVALDPDAACLVFPATAAVTAPHAPGWTPWRSAP
jgi:aminopeptidase N